MDGKKEEEAVFWCTLLGETLFDGMDKGVVHPYLKNLAGQEVTFPDGSRRKLSYWTLRRKYRKYRKDGFKALFRKSRADLGKPRSVSSAMVARAIELKKDQPRRSPEAINRFLEAEFGKTIPPSTLYRHLKDAGATRRKLGIDHTKVRCRWTRDKTHDMWVGDFEHGPYVMIEHTAVRAHLSAWIDTHSRYIVEARYYYRENLDILIDSLLRAWANHGASRELYVDNAKVYHSDALKVACCALGIRLRHRPIRDPATGGLIERFFQTAQSQFEAEVNAGEILTLEKLNRSFSAWLSISYHQAIHSETKQTPEARYHQNLTVIRQVDTQEILQHFWRRESRKVDPKHSDVRVHGRCYKVDPKFRGDKIEVRYDPFSLLEKIFLYSLRGEYLGSGVLYNREKSETPSPSSNPSKPKYDYLGLLTEQHEKKLNTLAQGIDYLPLINQRAWSFIAFLNKFAHLSGHKDGLSAFSTQETEFLKNFYDRFPSLNESMLIQAFENAQPKTLASILYQLQLLADKKEN